MRESEKERDFELISNDITFIVKRILEFSISFSLSKKECDSFGCTKKGIGHATRTKLSSTNLLTTKQSAHTHTH